SEVDELGANATIPVINGLTDYDHPTQALADWITIREKFGKDISGRKFVYLGDGNNVTTAWLMMGAIMGAHVVAATPSGKWSPDTKVVETAKKIAQANGGTIEVTHDPIAAAKDAAVLYTDVWMSMGDPESERKEKEKALAPFKITEKLMATAASDSIFMHCLPAHRGEEVDAAVIDGPRSVIWREAFHRRTTIQAIIFHLVRGELKG
ncbi:MAG: hypothetical protein RLZZ581_968, partial [Actinomycetota bacterium]